MSKYTEEQLQAMQDDELSFVYEEVIPDKTMPATKKRNAIIQEILAAQEEQAEIEEERESAKKRKPKAAPITSVRSTMLKPKSPPKTSLAKLAKGLQKQPSLVKTLEPQTTSLELITQDIESEENDTEGSDSAKPKRGRPPKKVEKLSLTSSSEEEIKSYEPPRRIEEQGSKVDDILEKIKKSAKVSLLNPRASFQKGDVVRERESQTITPVVISEANLVSIQLPIHEEAKKSITDFLHDVGFAEGEAAMPSPKKVVTPKKKAAVSVDEELERLATATSVPSVEEEDEDFVKLVPSKVSKIPSMEPVQKSVRESLVKPGKAEKSIRKSVNEILQEEEAKRLEEDLRYAKERELESEKERELEQRTLEDEMIRKKLTRRPVVIKETTAEGEEIEEPSPQPELEETELEEKQDEEEREERELRKTLLKNPEKWEDTPLEDIPLTEMKSYNPTKKAPKAAPTMAATMAAAKGAAKGAAVTKPSSKPSSKKKEKLEEMLTEIEEPEPMVVKKTIKKTAVEDRPLTKGGPKDVVKSFREIEEEIENPEEPKSVPKSKPSSKKKKQVENVDVLPILENIERERLGSGRGKNLYNLKEVQDIVKQILPGVKITGKKKEELVELIEGEFKKYGL